jgi:hypothetical protein
MDIGVPLVVLFIEKSFCLSVFKPDYLEHNGMKVCYLFSTQTSDNTSFDLIYSLRTRPGFARVQF